MTTDRDRTNTQATNNDSGPRQKRAWLTRLGKLAKDKPGGAIVRVIWDKQSGQRFEYDADLSGKYAEVDLTPEIRAQLPDDATNRRIEATLAAHAATLRANAKSPGAGPDPERYLKTYKNARQLILDQARPKVPLRAIATAICGPHTNPDSKNQNPTIHNEFRVAGSDLQRILGSEFSEDKDLPLTSTKVKPFLEGVTLDDSMNADDDADEDDGTDLPDAVENQDADGTVPGTSSDALLLDDSRLKDFEETKDLSPSGRGKHKKYFQRLAKFAQNIGADSTVTVFWKANRSLSFEVRLEPDPMVTVSTAVKDQFLSVRNDEILPRLTEDERHSYQLARDRVVARSETGGAVSLNDIAITICGPLTKPQRTSHRYGINAEFEVSGRDIRRILGAAFNEQENLLLTDPRIVDVLRSVALADGDSDSDDHPGSDAEPDVPPSNEPAEGPPVLDLSETPLTLLLEGVPGTGKTYRIRKIVEGLKEHHEVDGDGTGEFAITMHPATTYEEFVEGLRPAVSTVTTEMGNKTVRAKRGGTGKELTNLFTEDVPAVPQATFQLRDGFFLRVCAQAARAPDKLFVVLLDEFNRCNVPKVMGDLLTTIEPSKRATWKTDDGGYWDVTDCPCPTLPASGRLFFVPDNVIVVATMNSSDRSVGALDAALKRRFTIERVEPMSESDFVNANLPELSTPSIKAWLKLNEALKEHFGPEAMLGHSYLFDIAAALENREGDRRFYRAESPVEVIRYYWTNQILRQLCESIDAAHGHNKIDELTNAMALVASAIGYESVTLGVTTHALVQATRVTYGAEQADVAAASKPAATGDETSP